MAVTIKDIAKQAGVSTATVSRVLSDQTAFYSEKTAKKVKKQPKNLAIKKIRLPLNWLPVAAR
ncbi:hypothetical protein LBUCD034_0150 [Lentilactobacillus buchneri subsp. silagei CD034]|uniref:HTH lacI-type domain-containing protein n=1 Tax=Lentilactobacillus buchneri subsp. silagei CD034 TaxID=1071400 RepID=J9W2J8_LENBU|nr:hypothetical protein LBUCD034_0150 [Lentilactobacillus buchneri subsp. silagei CD034]